VRFFIVPDMLRFVPPFPPYTQWKVVWLMVWFVGTHLCSGLVASVVEVLVWLVVKPLLTELGVNDGVKWVCPGAFSCYGSVSASKPR
jgi:hypothetical protein